MSTVMAPLILMILKLST